MKNSNGTNIRAECRMGSAARVATAVLLGLLVSACAGSGIKTDRDVARDRVEAYLAANPATDKRAAASMRRFHLRRGMTEAQVIAVWGTPRNKYKWGREDQLFFECAYWPNVCGSSGRTGGGDDEDSRYPQAFFSEGLLTDWTTP